MQRQERIVYAWYKTIFWGQKSCLGKGQSKSDTFVHPGFTWRQPIVTFNQGQRSNVKICIKIVESFLCYLKLAEVPKFSHPPVCQIKEQVPSSYIQRDFVSYIFMDAYSASFHVYITQPRCFDSPTQARSIAKNNTLRSNRKTHRILSKCFNHYCQQTQCIREKFFRRSLEVRLSKIIRSSLCIHLDPLTRNRLYVCRSTMKQREGSIEGSEAVHL